MDEAGIGEAHVVGNSLGGYVALQLAARGRARTVTALAPAGGWGTGDDKQDTLAMNEEAHVFTQGAERNAAFIASTPQGRRQALATMAEHTDHVPPEFVVNVIRAGALCVEAPRMIAYAAQSDWPLETPQCPTRIVWGTEDKLLPWPRAAARYRRAAPARRVDRARGRRPLPTGGRADDHRRADPRRRRLTYSDIGICCVAWPEQRRQRMCSTRWPSRAGATSSTS